MSICFSCEGFYPKTQIIKHICVWCSSFDRIVKTPKESVVVLTDPEDNNDSKENSSSRLEE